MALHIIIIIAHALGANGWFSPSSNSKVGPHDIVDVCASHLSSVYSRQESLVYSTGRSTLHICTRFHENQTSRSSTVIAGTCYENCARYRLHWVRNGNGFRASSAVWKRYDGFLSDLVGQWKSVDRRRTLNFTPMRLADRSQTVCVDLVSNGSLAVESRAAFANASSYPHDNVHRLRLAFTRHPPNFKSNAPAISKQLSTHGTC